MQPSGIAATPGAALGASPQNEYGVPVAQQLVNGMQPYREPAAGGRTSATGTITPTSGTEYLTAVPMFAGDVITSLSFFSASVLTMGTNADGHLWVSLRQPNGTLIAQTADQGGSATWASGAWKTLALAGGPYTIAQSGLYLVGMMQNAGTGGSPATAQVRGNASSSAFWSAGASGQPAGQHAYGWSGTTGNTGTAPATPTLVNSGNWLYCVTS